MALFKVQCDSQAQHNVLQLTLNKKKMIFTAILFQFFLGLYIVYKLGKCVSLRGSRFSFISYHSFMQFKEGVGGVSIKDITALLGGYIN